LVDVFDAVYGEDPESALLAHYADRIAREVPDSGAVEYIAAHRAFFDAGDRRGAERQLKAAIRKAERAGDAGVAEAARLELDRLQGPTMDIALLHRLMDLFPDGPPDLDELKDLPDEFFEDLF
jgi:hypothetical protein